MRTWRCYAANAQGEQPIPTHIRWCDTHVLSYQLPGRRRSFNVVHHGSDVAGISIVFLNEPGCFSLDLFESVNVFVFIGVPHRAGVLEYRADEGNIGGCFEMFITITASS